MNRLTEWELDGLLSPAYRETVGTKLESGAAKPSLLRRLRNWSTLSTLLRTLLALPLEILRVERVDERSRARKVQVSRPATTARNVEYWNGH